VFKAIFTKDKAISRAALSDLISALIGRVIVVETITANEPPVSDLRQRYLRFDIACKTKEGKPINVEMSFNPKANELARLEYHVSRLFEGQEVHGKRAVFFEYLADQRKSTKIIEIINKEEGIAMAVKTMKGFTQKELDYIRESYRIKYELDCRTK